MGEPSAVCEAAASDVLRRWRTKSHPKKGTDTSCTWEVRVDGTQKANGWSCRTRADGPILRPTGKEVYAWEQTVDDVNVYVRAPQGCRAKDLEVDLRMDGIRLAMRGNTPYLDHRWREPIRTSESWWTLEDGVIALVLAKRERGKTWKSLLVGQEEFDPVQESEERKRLMLERFQRENPGFDFSGAELTGCCPDASQFMGGVASGT